MRIRITISLVTILLTLIFLPISAIALSPGPGLRYCWEKNNANIFSPSCEQMQCEFRNTERVWLRDGSALENCDVFAISKIKYYQVYIVPIAFILIILLVLFIRKRKKKSGLPITVRNVT